MNNLLNIKTPAEGEAKALKSDFGLDSHGIFDLRMSYWNLPTEALYEEIAFRGEGRITRLGPVVAFTGKHTARSASDKYIVREPSTDEHIWWGQYNKPFPPDKFDGLYNRLLGFMQGRDMFVQDCYVGADPQYRMPIRVVTEKAWHAMFARNMFILPQTNEDYRRHVPDFTVIAVPSFKAIPQIDGTASETFIILNFARRICIIGNTAYAGEIKKSVFTIMNYLMPLQGVMSMHSSANIGDDGNSAVFFGLSGTGKTTLSADPGRRLIGDDEHGWSDEGVFNYEGGCYAKVIRLSESAEPEIYATTRMFGTVLENVVFDNVTRMINLDDETVTENTRASYPLDYIANAVPEKKGGHPKNIILLTCDASGVMPPISKLSPEQAIYQFISGYTSKIAGTEVGLGKDPELTFSTCFGAPFMVHHPMFYADILRRKVVNHRVNCWLLNTGWIGGAFGVGKRISIGYTRTLLNAALDGSLLKSKFVTDPVFGFQVPTSCEGVPSNVLDPAGSWPSVDEYMKKYKQLASRFVENFRKFEPNCPPEIVVAGPKV